MRHLPRVGCENVGLMLRIDMDGVVAVRCIVAPDFLESDRVLRSVYGHLAKACECRRCLDRLVYMNQEQIEMQLAAIARRGRTYQTLNLGYVHDIDPVSFYEPLRNRGDARWEVSRDRRQPLYSEEERAAELRRLFDEARVLNEELPRPTVLPAPATPPPQVTAEQATARASRPFWYSRRGL